MLLNTSEDTKLVKKTAESFSVSNESPQLQELKRKRIPEWVMLGGTTADHLAQPPCSSKVTPEHMAQDCVQTILEYLQ